MNSGIYKLTNIKTGKYYVGRSCNLKDRKYRHLLSLRKGSHHNRYLQRAYNKDGENSFVFEVIEYTDDLVQKEQEYFRAFNCENKELCYNLRDIVDRLQPDETRYTRIVSQFNKDGNWIKTYRSIREASKEVGVSDSFINSVLCGRKKTAKGYRWQYGDSKQFVELYVKSRYKYKDIFCLDNNNAIVKAYNTFEEVKMDFKETKHIYEVLNGKRKSAYGFKWIANKKDVFDE